ncbi:hypothetical protein [Micromonospora avicenniae]|uniref:hypothetical protein n=1 Tax=Micromonospora avicenniae TaxID=1198245 RepID=UPI003321E131
MNGYRTATVRTDGLRIEVGKDRFDIVEVGRTTKFLTYIIGTEDDARKAVFMRRKETGSLRVAARRADGTFLVNPR